MRARRIVALAVALAVLAGAAGCDLNLKGQTRYTVGQVTYGVAGVEAQGAVIEVSLTRVDDEPVTREDAEAIASVDGIALVNDLGERVPPAEVRLGAGAEAAYAVMAFDVGELRGPWTLEWPGHEPFEIGL